MASTGEPVCRLCRREGERLYLKGYRCYGKKCPFSRPDAPVPPGQHGRARQQKMSDYGMQLREKQKLRRIYGLREKQFRLFMKEAERRRGITGENLLQLLEMRLDNAVFRLGLASSRLQARQFVSHRHIMVNDRVVGIASFMLRPGDKIQVRDSSKSMMPIVESMKASAGGRAPAWLQVNTGELSGQVLSAPTRQEIDTDVEEALIVEFYSR